MSEQVSKVYRCKQCRTVIRRAEARQEHCYWHHITDKNIDAYFIEEEESVETPDVGGVDAASRDTKTGPSYGVLAASAALLVAVAVLYAVAN